MRMPYLARNQIRSVCMCVCVYVRVCGACVRADVCFARQVDCFYTVKIHLNFYVV